MPSGVVRVSLFLFYPDDSTYMGNPFPGYEYFSSYVIMVHPLYATPATI